MTSEEGVTRVKAIVDFLLPQGSTRREKAVRIVAAAAGVVAVVYALLQAVQQALN